jgi:hypothetical protein
MEKIKCLISQFAGLAEQQGSGLTATIAIAVTTVSLVVFASRRTGPPRLFDPIPFVFNTVQYILNNEKFMVRVK